MKNLVAKFQEELEVSKGNAIFRIVKIFFFVACFITIIVSTVINFPYKRDLTIGVAVPKSNYEIVETITEQGIKLKDEKQFYSKLSSNDTVFVSVSNFGIAIFMFNKNGITFYYKKETKTGFNSFFSQNYKIKEINIDDNTLSIKKVRSASSVFFRMIILPILCLFFFFVFTLWAQCKRNGSGYDENGKWGEKYLSVWL